ncbi:MAG TPA: ImmA/IrrE family metallo-endopeptidase [Desulfosporosinus sp.]|nr:ImmA/IrrE family metallo-endopeptidase [Desulfosporosinus sp.]
MTYDGLVSELEKEGVEVLEHSFSSRALKGLYVDNVIAINSKAMANESEKACILAEEYGHYRTTYGNILDQKKVSNVKQEKRARNWAYEKLVSIEKLIEAYEAGVRSCYDLTEFLGVTEDFLHNALNHYAEKFGLYVRRENYVIYFSPLGIFHGL